MVRFSAKKTPRKYLFLIGFLAITVLFFVVDYLSTHSDSTFKVAPSLEFIKVRCRLEFFFFWGEFVRLRNVEIKVFGFRDLNFQIICRLIVSFSFFVKIRGVVKDPIALALKFNATYADIPAPTLEWEEMPAAPVGRLDGYSTQIGNLLYVFAGYATIDHVRFFQSRFIFLLIIRKVN